MNQLKHINSIHELEYLTNFEADRVLRDYLKQLSTNGTIKIIVLDIDYYAKQWLNAIWDESTIKNKDSGAQQSFQALWGEQISCDPWSNDYNKAYTSVRKSGYNQKRLNFLLSRIGYININIISNNGILEVIASKPLGGGERQDSTTLKNIRLDHRKRYEFASTFITKKNSIVTDGACGVAYGSYILAQNPNTKIVQAIDISSHAVAHGKQYFANDKIQYHLSNLEDNEIPSQNSDYYISFETIEHLPNPDKYIEKISNNIKKDGIFIGSVPNEDIMPYTKYFSYHTRHFTVGNLKEILEKYGFNSVKFFQQKRDKPSDILNIKDGQYIIFVAKKKRV